MRKSFKITIVVLCTLTLAAGWGVLVANPLLGVLGGMTIGFAGAQIGLLWCD